MALFAYVVLHLLAREARRVAIPLAFETRATVDTSILYEALPLFGAAAGTSFRTGLVTEVPEEALLATSDALTIIRALGVGAIRVLAVLLTSGPAIEARRARRALAIRPLADRAPRLVTALGALLVAVLAVVTAVARFDAGARLVKDPIDVPILHRAFVAQRKYATLVRRASPVTEVTVPPVHAGEAFPTPSTQPLRRGTTIFGTRLVAKQARETRLALFTFPTVVQALAVFRTLAILRAIFTIADEIAACFAVLGARQIATVAPDTLVDTLATEVAA